MNAKVTSTGYANELIERAGQSLDAIMENSNSIILNDSTPTYFRYSGEYKGVLDLVIVSPKLASSCSDFVVNEFDTHGSDHAPITATFELDNKIRIISLTPVPKFDFNKANWASFRNHLNSTQPGGLRTNGLLGLIKRSSREKY